MTNIDSNIQNLIDKYGYAVIAVAADDSDKNPGFLYTVGLSASLDYEIIMIADANPAIMNIVINDMVDELMHENDVNGIKYPARLADGTSLRAILKDVSLDETILSNVTIREGTVDKIYQLVLADSNNILPGEEGYDEKFVQAFT